MSFPRRKIEITRIVLRKIGYLVAQIEITMSFWGQKLGLQGVVDGWGRLPHVVA